MLAAIDIYMCIHTSIIYIYGERERDRERETERVLTLSGSNSDFQNMLRKLRAVFSESSTAVS